MIAARAWISACVVIGFLAGTANALNMETVPVGNPGNVPDTRYNGIAVGSVAYRYQIGKYEVTAGQYTEFLNAVAKTDTHGLYDTSMWTSTYGCKIEQTGSSGNYSYSVAPEWANRPVNYVNWSDAARFANWMHNGQRSGAQDASTTEDGSYYLNGTTGATVTRKVNATWVVPSEDEWYKAAYHKNDGVTGNYFDYPTSSNNTPSNVLGTPTDPGNSATYYNGSYTIGSPYYRTEVGAHENSASPYGTFDQGGNVWESNEAISQEFGNWFRGIRGGSCLNDRSLNSPHASDQRFTSPNASQPYLGFRVAYVPEPCTALLAVVGVLGLLTRVRPCHRAGTSSIPS